MKEENNLNESNLDLENDEFNWSQYLKSTRFLTLHLYIFGGAWSFITILISGENFENRPTSLIFTATGALIMAVSSLFMIIKKDVPRSGKMKSIKGVPAVIIGTLSLILWGSGGLYLLWGGISLLIHGY